MRTLWVDDGCDETQGSELADRYLCARAWLAQRGGIRQRLANANSPPNKLSIQSRNTEYTLRYGDGGRRRSGMERWRGQNMLKRRRASATSDWEKVRRSDTRGWASG